MGESKSTVSIINFYKRGSVPPLIIKNSYKNFMMSQDEYEKWCAELEENRKNNKSVWIGEQEEEQVQTVQTEN